MVQVQIEGLRKDSDEKLLLLVEATEALEAMEDKMKVERAKVEEQSRTERERFARLSVEQETQKQEKITILEARLEFLQAEVVRGERCREGGVERHLAAEAGGGARGRGKAAAASDEICDVAKSRRRKGVEAGVAEAAAERRDDKAENLRTEEMLLAVLKDLDGIPRCGEVRCRIVQCSVVQCSYIMVCISSGRVQLWSKY